MIGRRGDVEWERKESERRERESHRETVVETGGEKRGRGRERTVGGRQGLRRGKRLMESQR